MSYCKHKVWTGEVCQACVNEKREARDRSALANAAEWLSLEVSGHIATCTCGSCYAVAKCAHLITGERSRHVAVKLMERLLDNEGEKLSSVSSTEVKDE